MPIISKAAQREGHFITLTYEFSDGIIKVLRVRGRTDIDAARLLESKEAYVLASKQIQDLELAILSDSDTPSQDVTQAQVYKAWMIKGFQSDDPIEAYRYLSKVAAKVLALGLTTQQLATLFEEDEGTAEAVLSKWQYLKANKAAIAAYKVIKDGI